MENKSNQKRVSSAGTHHSLMCVHSCEELSAFSIRLRTIKLSFRVERLNEDESLFDPIKEFDDGALLQLFPFKRLD